MILPGLAKLGEVMRECERDRLGGNDKKKLKEEIKKMKSIELDGIEVLGNAIEKNGIVQINIPIAEELKIRNANASCHKLYGKPFDVSSIIIDCGIMRIFGRYTDKPKSHLDAEGA
jgi:hypothetical protein